MADDQVAFRDQGRAPVAAWRADRQQVDADDGVTEFAEQGLETLDVADAAPAPGRV